MNSGGGGDGGAEVDEEILDTRGEGKGKGRLASGEEGEIERKMIRNRNGCCEAAMKTKKGARKIGRSGSRK